MKIKVAVILIHTSGEQRYNSILNPEVGWRWMVNFRPGRFVPWK